MKTIRDFLASKIRRAEVGDRIHLLPLDLPHRALGAPEAVIESSEGAAAFYENGFVVGTDVVAYENIIAINAATTDDGERTVDVTRQDGQVLRIHATPAGGRVLFDTLRWIGRAKLRRKLD